MITYPFLHFFLPKGCQVFEDGGLSCRIEMADGQIGLSVPM